MSTATQAAAPATHPFLTAPHKTILTLSFPLLLSLIAEPLTGLIDTGFVAQLGAEPLAALGVGTIALSSFFWVFNFLGIGTQTEVAQALGKGEGTRAGQIVSLALVLSFVFGVLVIALLYPNLNLLAQVMGATGDVEALAVAYMRLRLFGAPAVLITLAAFGALRGLQDMRTPLWIAIIVNGLNILLDAWLIFGWGPVEPLGVRGAALASTVSQWIGAITAILIIRKQLGLSTQINFGDAVNLIKVGGDLFIRTAMLMVFLLLATRTATQISTESGAAHQAIRQVWIFSALVLEAFAMTAQSLVGYFIGSGAVQEARRVVAVCAGWALGTGVLLAAGMLAGQAFVISILVPAAAVAPFTAGWLIASLTQPINSLAFITDGIHWGTGDYRYLRNGMILATLSGGLMLLLIDHSRPEALLWVWVATAVWILVRSVWGIIRVWPGVGETPFRVDHKR